MGDSRWVPLRGVGFGLVAQDGEWLPLAVGYGPVTRVVSPLMAEILFLRWALQIALVCGFRKVTFDTDCQALFNAWHEHGLDISYFTFILVDCKPLAMAFDFFLLCLLLGGPGIKWQILF